MAMPKHFLDIDRLDGDTLRTILDLGQTLKQKRLAGDRSQPLAARRWS
jgi:ornithine carbamoyltransferase